MNMRRMLAAVLAATMAVSLMAGCGGSPAPSSGSTGGSGSTGSSGGSDAPAKTVTVGMECTSAPFNWTQVEATSTRWRWRARATPAATTS